MRRFWSAGDIEVLRALYPLRPSHEVAKALNRSLSAVYGMADKVGLSKSEDYLTGEFRDEACKRLANGAPFRFGKGHVPFNKDLRRPGWHKGRMKETQFKPGCRSGKAALNWCPIGTIKADSEGFLRIKIREAVHGKEPSGFGNPKVWPLLNRHVWEQHKGPIPPKHIIAFKDRDRSNCAIENLELMSMADNARRNNMWATMPRDLAEVIQLNGALKRRLRRMTNGAK